MLIVYIYNKLKNIQISTMKNEKIKLYTATLKDDLVLNFNFFFKDKESKIYF